MKGLYPKLVCQLVILNLKVVLLLKHINNELVSGLFIKAKCLFHGDKFIYDGEILSFYQLVIKYLLTEIGTVWCGGKRIQNCCL